jgi:hypothetical protein
VGEAPEVLLGLVELAANRFEVLLRLQGEGLG